MAETLFLRRLAVGVAIIALCGQALLTAGRPLLVTDARAKSETEGLERLLSALDHAGLRERLQAETVIGYASDQPVDTRQGGAPELRYYLAQHALAPVLIDERPTRHVLLAHFQNKKKFLQFVKARNATILVRVTPKIALVEVASP